MNKKFFTSLIISAALLSSSVSAFKFPEPDWAALLKEKREMVGQTEFELYAEADPDTAPYYGAKLEPRAGTYIGMIAEESEDFAPVGSYLTYIEGMWQDDLYYPANEMIENDNVVATIGWTIGDIDGIDYGQVRRVLNNLASRNKPMFIRFANEMNVSSIGDDPDKYVAAFRRVADMVHEYPNFAMVWSPNDLGGLDRPFNYYYPGNEYVDWVGISSYGKRYFQGNKDTSDVDAAYFMTGKYAWATNAIKPILKFMEDYGINKPIMISECGVSTNTVYGEDMTEWASPRLRNLYWYLVMKYPQVKLINSFNTHRANENERYDISNYPYASDIFKEAADSGAYLRSADDEADFVFQPANNAGALVANNGIVRLYTLAYIPDKPEMSVNYTLDGEWYHSSNQIPYICNMDVSAISDGKHTLTIDAWGLSQTYNFYKSGNVIQFGSPIKNSDLKIVVTINGSPVRFSQEPIIKDGRTLVPMRKIFETLGATVEWDDKTKTVTATRGETEIVLQIGSNLLIVNDRVVELDVPAMIENDRTMVPARAVAESLDCQVDWDGNTRTVMIMQ